MLFNLIKTVSLNPQRDVRMDVRGMDSAHWKTENTIVTVSRGGQARTVRSHWR